MNTEITDKQNRETSGWVFYDAECALCRRWMSRTEKSLNRLGFKFVPLQTDWAKERLGMNQSAALTEVRLLLADGRTFGVADAAMEIARHIWWAWPVWMISKIPGVIFLCRAVYRFIASNRHCHPRKFQNRHSAFFEFP